MVNELVMRMKIRLTQKRIIILSIILVGLILAFGVYYFLKSVKPSNEIEYMGRIFKFRDDVRLAEKIKVIPDEKTIHDLFWSNNLKKITIVFKPVQSQTGYYAVEAFELSNKLELMYLLNGKRIDFKGENVTSYENLTSTPDNLKIVLVHPLLTNKTLIESKNNLVFIYGKDEKDFDLVTIKLILTAMGKF